MIENEKEFVCPLCGGQHGNNSNCQRNDRGDQEC